MKEIREKQKYEIKEEITLNHYQEANKGKRTISQQNETKKKQTTKNCWLLRRCLPTRLYFLIHF